MKFNVSDKVVCVDAKNIHLPFSAELIEGRVYCVHGHSWNGSLYVVGIRGPIDGFYREIGFCPSRFKLLSKVKQENANKAKKNR